MKRGPRPLPTELKKLKGIGAHRINSNEPDFAPDLAAKAPFYFDDYSKALWEAVYPELFNKNVLKVTDRTVLETFCTAYGMYRTAFEDVKRRGRTITTKNGYEQENPSVNTMHKFMVLHNKTGDLLGLSPSSRSRIVGAVQEKTAGGIKEFMAAGFKHGQAGS